MPKHSQAGPKQTDTWLEPILTRELRRVAAPRSPLPIARTAARPAGLWFVCASAAGLLLASAVGLHAYISDAPPLAGRQTVKAVRFEAWIRASTGLNVHAACRLCHAGDELQAANPGGSQRLWAGAFVADVGVY